MQEADFAELNKAVKQFADKLTALSEIVWRELSPAFVKMQAAHNKYKYLQRYRRRGERMKKGRR